jgi:hypothetical protein
VPQSLWSCLPQGRAFATVGATDTFDALLLHVGKESSLLLRRLVCRTRSPILLVIKTPDNLG